MGIPKNCVSVAVELCKEGLSLPAVFLDFAVSPRCSILLCRVQSCDTRLRALRAAHGPGSGGSQETLSGTEDGVAPGSIQQAAWASAGPCGPLIQAPRGVPRAGQGLLTQGRIFPCR